MRAIAKYGVSSLMALGSMTGIYGTELDNQLDRRNLIATQGTSNLENQGSRDGRRYAEWLRSIGERADGTACAVRMANEDRKRPHLSQEKAEAYAKAFGNACVGRKIF